MPVYLPMQGMWTADETEVGRLLRLLLVRGRALSADTRRARLLWPDNFKLKRYQMDRCLVREDNLAMAYCAKVEMSCESAQSRRCLLAFVDPMLLFTD